MLPDGILPDLHVDFNRPDQGIVQVVVFGKVFDGHVGQRIDVNRFEVFVPALNNSIIIDRDVDYITTAPLPFAPMTRKGLRAAEIAARNGLAQMEFGTELLHRSTALRRDALS